MTSGLLRIAGASLWNRRATAALTVFAIALSVTLFLGVDKIRRGAEQSFESTVSGTDLIVGARSGPINLLLYSVFRIGEPTTNISWQSFETFRDNPQVAWAVPLSLGDSHAGFRVLGTTTDYFERYRYGGDRPLTLARGGLFEDVHDAVIGADVAAKMGYAIGDSFVISHGIVSAGFADHEDDPFIVRGILAPTGTPVDRTVHVSLAGIEAVHGEAAEMGDTPEQISAFLVGLQNRAMAPLLLRQVNTYAEEPLTAIMPGVALAQLWEVVGVAEAALTGTAAFVVVTGLLCLLIAILTSLNERRREMAVLRAAGASRRHIFSLLMMETLLLAAIGAAIGAAVVYGGLSALAPWLSARFGLPLVEATPGLYDVVVVGGVLLAAAVLGLIPALAAYRRSLADGLTVKL
jgi:putative ABC transport system permease protein